MKSADLAYWIGVVQTDGYFKKTYYKKRRLFRYQICLSVGYKSLPMLEKFKRISHEIFGVKTTVWDNKKTNIVQYQFGCKDLLPIFGSLSIDFSDPPKPPQWILDEKGYFGSYLAGVIDGDGDVRLHRSEYPQCSVRVTSGSPAFLLQKAIINQMSVGVSKSICHNSSIYQGRLIEGTSYKIEFYISPKNFFYFKNFVLDHMALNYKKSMIKNYIKKRESQI